MEPRSVAGFAGVKTDLTRRAGGTTPEKKIIELCIAFVSLLSPNNNGRQQYSNPEPKESLPKGPFTFTIVATHFFFHFWALELFVWLYYPYVKTACSSILL